jgi:DNA-binding NarL/FixJ family response regulator
MDAPVPFRVGLVVSQPLLASGIRFHLGGIHDLVLIDFNHFPEDLVVYQPDVLIMDDGFRDFFEGDPVSSSSIAILERVPTILVTSKDKDWIWRVHKSGIKGFVTTAIGSEEFVEGVFSVAKGGRFFSKPIIDVLVEKSFGAGPGKSEKLHDRLTEREMEILLLVASGRSSKEIAERLFLSPHTINTHRKHILRKLSCKSATELLNYAYSQGLIES